MTAGETLLPRRTTEVNYEDDDGIDTIEDTWDGDEGPRILGKLWTGRTIFYTDLSKERHGSPTQTDIAYSLAEEAVSYTHLTLPTILRV